MNANVTVETITPKMAGEWLGNKIELQRNIVQNHVFRLANEIRNGKFRLSSDAVVLLKGKLANGQHRLSAVMEAGKAAPFIVMRSDDDELFKVIDCGRTRQIYDVIVGVECAKTVSSAARLVLAYDKNFLGPTGDNKQNTKREITRSQILEYIEKNGHVIADQAKFCHGQYEAARIVGTTIATAFLHIASRKQPEMAREYISHVYTGEVVDASKDFRDRMIKQMGTKSRLRQAYVFALLIKCWRSFKNGTRPGTLKMADGELFPEI